MNILIPPSPESSNVIQFELILLESISVPKDYVVGWGVFPLLNSEFQVNEGKFKCPLLFGSANFSFDKFSRIEQQMMKDLDSWLCNVYFEIEKINLMDLKADERTGRLYFSPLYKLQQKKERLRLDRKTTAPMKKDGRSSGTVTLDDRSDRSSDDGQGDDSSAASSRTSSVTDSDEERADGSEGGLKRQRGSNPFEEESMIEESFNSLDDTLLNNTKGEEMESIEQSS